MISRGIAVLLFVAAGFAAGCAGSHQAMRGSVVMKVDPVKAHVCLGSGEVAVSDRVRVYRNVCTTSGVGAGSGHRSNCTKQTIADGVVTELLDEHYSVVMFPAGTTFEEGNTVEKL